MTDRTVETPQRRTPFGAPNVLALAVIEGTDVDSICRITREKTIVGRADDVQLQLADDQVSNEHVLIEVTGAVFRVTDLGSKNGTWLNHKRLEPGQKHPLKHLDEIQLGDTRLLFTASRFRGKKQ